MTSTSHQSQVPEVARAYFAKLGVTEHPVIGEIHQNRDARRLDGRRANGWLRFPIRKRISGAEVSRLFRSGVEWVRLDAGGHRADFRVEELR